MSEREDIEQLKHLGSNHTAYPTTYDPSLLERIDYTSFSDEKSPLRPIMDPKVELHCPEFTSLCPKTGQPDFASIKITYTPDKYLVESKSLKLYLFSFRNHGEFHEDCVSRIAQDIFKLIEPHSLHVYGDFYPRGGIKICPSVSLYKPFGESGEDDGGSPINAESLETLAPQIKGIAAL